ncbi:MAG: SDR family oxidoreductase [Vicinamibacteria bacterium]
MVHVQGDLEEERTLDLLSRTKPEAVVHLAALTDADVCEEHPERAQRSNAEIPERLASAVEESCRRFILVSTDLVFDGERGAYEESDPPRPISVYGRAKLEGEMRARAVLGDRATVVRLALVYGPRPHSAARETFVERMLESAAQGTRVALYTDEIRSPVYVEDAALGLARLLELDVATPSTLHLGGPDPWSRFEMGAMALSTFGLDPDLGEARLRSDARTKAPRPRDVSLDSSRARALGLPSRGLADGLEAMKGEMERRGFMVGS